MSTTARDLIKGSLRLIGSIAAGETPSASELSDALNSLNEMIASWSNDGYLIFSRHVEEFGLTGGQQVYTIGSGGDFNTARPVRIIQVGTKEGPGLTEIPISQFNVQEWSNIGLKSTQSTLPQGIYYNPSYPLGEISVWPVPSGSARLVLYTAKPLAQIATADDVLTMPPGYLRALRYNLAVELADEYGKAVTQRIELIAAESKAVLMRMNTDSVLMTSDAAELVMRSRTFNWLTGE
jgi:hypothetical protein